MKLDTVTIKINETEENRRNYAVNIAHLKVCIHVCMYVGRYVCM